MSSAKPSILLQLDSDPQPSVFDAVVAVDAGVDHVFRHGGVTPAAVRDLVHGLLFTRGGADLARSAVFIGGSDVAAAEALMTVVRAVFFAGFRVSVLFDANGANTTAAAAVLAAEESMEGSLEGVSSAVLGATGPVGQRVARLLARSGAAVKVGSRRIDRARATAATLAETVGVTFTPFGAEDLAGALEGVSVVIAAGAPGVTLLPESVRAGLAQLRVAIDLNAVPPPGIEGVKPADKGAERGAMHAWGALGVGGTKMKIHKKAVQELFTSNDKVLDAEEILEIGRSLAR